MNGHFGTLAIRFGDAVAILVRVAAVAACFARFAAVVVHAAVADDVVVRLFVCVSAIIPSEKKTLQFQDADDSNNCITYALKIHTHRRLCGIF